jgi:putative nucleotidyltransferase with HDIG domain
MKRAAEPKANLGQLTRALPETAVHSRRVADLAVVVGLELGIGPERSRNLRTGALFHDVGKLWVPREVLAKPGPLTDEERRIVHRHAFWSAVLARHAGLPIEVVMLVLLHHERVDGSGPLGLGGNDVPIDARILAACDVYDALRSDRPYRRAWGQEQALGFLRLHSGRLFDADCVGALGRAIESELTLNAAA